LIDSVGYLDDAVALACQLGNCPAARVVILHRSHDRARSPYDITPNTPFQGNLLPISIPGYERSQMPTFLYLWQPEPTVVRRSSGM
jgi:protease-4